LREGKKLAFFLIAMRVHISESIFILMRKHCFVISRLKYTKSRKGSTLCNPCIDGMFLPGVILGPEDVISIAREITGINHEGTKTGARK
jgi:hypothetical protein